MFSNSEGPDQLHAGALLTQAWQQICGHAVRKQGVTPLPLLRFDFIEGRSESDVRNILNVTHDVLDRDSPSAETRPLPGRARAQAVSHDRGRHRSGICPVGPRAPASSHEPPAKPRDEGKILSLAG